MLKLRLVLSIVFIVQALSHRIRYLRRLQKRTLKDISGRCGFTVSLLSKIESGKTVPPLATLSRIASALGVSLGNLLEPSDEKTTVFTPAIQGDSEDKWTRTGKGYTFRALAPDRAKKLMQPILFTAKKGEISPGPLSHSGEEYIQVLEGSMRYHVGAQSWTLHAGDSLYFNAEEQHDLDPISETVRFLAVFCERPTRQGPESLTSTTAYE